MKKTIFLFLLFVKVFHYETFAQISLLQDKSGETSILFKNKNLVLLNAEDKSVSANCNIGNTNYFIGFDIRLKSTEGISKILDGYKFKPKVDLGFIWGKPIKKAKESVTHFYYLGIKFNYTNFNLLKNEVSSTFQEKTFFGGSINIGYNKIGSINKLMKGGLSSSYLFGISANYNLTNNLEDLKPVETYTLFTKDTGYSKVTSISDKKSGHMGDYVNFGSLKINLDFYIFPQKIGGRIGAGGYCRSQLTGISPRTNAGIGIILGEKDAPSNIILGIFYQFNDLFNQLKVENDIIKRGGINIIAGYIF